MSPHCSGYDNSNSNDDGNLHKVLEVLFMRTDTVLKKKGNLSIHKIQMSS